MSVIMTLRVKGDPAKLEQYAADNPEAIQGISRRAQDEYGCIAHRFYGGDDEVIVIDEWPDQQSFERFFEAEQGAIGPIMQEVATGEPEIRFWRKLETNDETGWGA
jgi:quinol monooxygenase YgiN